MKQKRFVTILKIFLVLFLFSLSGPALTIGAEKALELSFGFNTVKGDFLFPAFYDPWIEGVEKKSEGRLKITVYPGQSLFQQKDTYDAIINGVVDIGWGGQMWMPGKFPLTSVVELPFLFDSSLAATRALYDLFPKFLRNEYKNMKVIQISTYDPKIPLALKPIHTPNDLKGLKSYVAGTTSQKAVSMLGAVPVNVQFPELYDSLSRRVVDMAFMNPSACPAAGLDKGLVKYATFVGFGQSQIFMAMNKKKYNSLPPDLQKVIDDFSGLHIGELQAKAWDNRVNDVFDIMKKNGTQVIVPTPAEVQLWREAAKPVADWWISDMKSKGLPGQEIYDMAVELAKKYNRQK